MFTNTLRYLTFRRLLVWFLILNGLVLAVGALPASALCTADVRARGFACRASTMKSYPLAAPF
ncbi:MAG: hypothetical protein NXI24_15795 [bacterium]|nr:hypothetical protein [bacterium]